MIDNGLTLPIAKLPEVSSGLYVNQNKAQNGNQMQLLLGWNISITAEHNASREMFWISE